MISIIEISFVIKFCWVVNFFVFVKKLIYEKLVEKLSNGSYIEKVEGKYFSFKKYEKKSL